MESVFSPSKVTRKIMKTRGRENHELLEHYNAV